VTGLVFPGTEQSADEHLVEHAPKGRHRRQPIVRVADPPDTTRC